MRWAVWTASGIASAFTVGQYLDSRSTFHKKVTLGLLHKLDPELSHEVVIRALSLGLGPRDTSSNDPILQQEIFGRNFSNPVGLAAGFDKNAQAVKSLTKLGFGFVEVGSVTPNPQQGNPRPRVFRLPLDGAIINRYGFNNDGLATVEGRLAKYALSAGSTPCLLGVNLGKNFSQQDPAADYVTGVKTLGPYADYLVVNVSSPNTPGLLKLQVKDQLSSLLDEVCAARDRIQATRAKRHIPLFLKISPDLVPQDLQDVASVVLSKGVDGVIITNTTTSRPSSLQSPSSLVSQAGGLSGEPLKEMSNETLRQMYQLTGGKVVLIGVGGISNGQDAYQRIRSGASLVQVYSSLIYQGFGLVPEIKEELAALLRKDGFNSIAEAVGVDAKSQ